MEGKKISFGFMKTKKVQKPIEEEKKEYIECLDKKSIKIVGGEKPVESTPLVIPMKPNTLITAERLKQIAEEVEGSIQSSDVKESTTELIEPENETLNQRVVRELLQDAKKEIKVDTPQLTLPIPSVPTLEGKKESTLDDYEAVPIQDFGLAMLRGMGWTPGKEQSKQKAPQLRPKGLGLGADKVVKKKEEKAKSKDDEELMIIKDAYVKINVGKYKGCYGKVLSLDEDNGRVMVDIAVKKENVSLSEFMMEAVTKSEFDKMSRVINADKYDEYKKAEQSQKNTVRNNSPKVAQSESSSSRSIEHSKDLSEQNIKEKKEDSANGRSKERSNRNKESSDSEARSRKKHKELRKKYSSNESLSSSSDRDKRSKYKESKNKYSDSDSSDSEDDRKHKKHKKHKKRNGSPAKRDIDKKRKGKKKKRDRDRSPNYKKHRK